MSDTNPATNLDESDIGNAIFGDLTATDPEPELTDSEKIDYVFQIAVKVGELVNNITSEQVEQVRKVYQNPLLRKILGG